MVGKQRLRVDEYFLQQAWPGHADDRDAYVGSVANKRLNDWLTAKGADNQKNLLTDKFLTGVILKESGFPVPEIKAVAGAFALYGKAPILRSADALADWLNNDANLPAFAKPVDGSMALGSVPLMRASTGTVDVGGRVVETRTLAQDVIRFFPRGWLIQEQLQQPVEIEALIGPGIGTVRLVTLWEERGPTDLYGVWRHPAPGTWVDAAIHGKPNVGCALDSNGQFTMAWVGDLFNGKDITHSLINPNLPLVGFSLSQWNQIVSIGKTAHRLFPGHALLGWDFAMTRKGPVISEVNCNPLHMSYQRSFRRGFLHPEHRARLEAAQELMLRRCKEKTRKGSK